MYERMVKGAVMGTSPVVQYRYRYEMYPFNIKTFKNDLYFERK